MRDDLAAVAAAAMKASDCELQYVVGRKGLFHSKLVPMWGSGAVKISKGSKCHNLHLICETLEPVSAVENLSHTRASMETQTLTVSKKNMSGFEKKIGLILRQSIFDR